MSEWMPEVHLDYEDPVTHWAAPPPWSGDKWWHRGGLSVLALDGRTPEVLGAALNEHLETGRVAAVIYYGCTLSDAELGVQRYGVIVAGLDRRADPEGRAAQRALDEAILRGVFMAEAG